MASQDRATVAAAADSPSTSRRASLRKSKNISYAEPEDDDEYDDGANEPYKAPTEEDPGELSDDSTRQDSMPPPSMHEPQDPQERSYSEAVKIQDGILALQKLADQLTEDLTKRKAELDREIPDSVNHETRITPVTSYGVLRTLLDICAIEPEVEDAKKKLVDYIREQKLTSNGNESSVRRNRSRPKSRGSVANNVPDKNMDASTENPLLHPQKDSSVAEPVWAFIKDFWDIMRAEDNKASSAAQSHVDVLKRHLLYDEDPEDWHEIRLALDSLRKRVTGREEIKFIRAAVFGHRQPLNDLTYVKIFDTIERLRREECSAWSFPLEFLNQTLKDKASWQNGFARETSNLIKKALSSLEVTCKEIEDEGESITTLQYKLFIDRMLHHHWLEKDYAAIANGLEVIGNRHPNRSYSWGATTLAPLMAKLEKDLAEMNLNTAPEVSSESPSSIRIQFHTANFPTPADAIPMFRSLLANHHGEVPESAVSEMENSLVTSVSDTKVSRERLVGLCVNEGAVLKMLRFSVKGITWNPASTYVKFDVPDLGNKDRKTRNGNKRLFEKILKRYKLEDAEVFENPSGFVAYFTYPADSGSKMTALWDEHKNLQQLHVSIEGNVLSSEVEAKGSEQLQVSTEENVLLSEVEAKGSEPLPASTKGKLLPSKAEVEGALRSKKRDRENDEIDQAQENPYKERREPPRSTFKGSEAQENPYKERREPPRPPRNSGGSMKAAGGSSQKTPNSYRERSPVPRPNDRRLSGDKPYQQQSYNPRFNNGGGGNPDDRRSKSPELRYRPQSMNRGGGSRGGDRFRSPPRRPSVSYPDEDRSYRRDGDRLRTPPGGKKPKDVDNLNYG